LLVSLSSLEEHSLLRQLVVNLRGLSGCRRLRLQPPYSLVALRARVLPALPLQPGRLPSGLMCAFVIARATHTLLDLATLSNQRPLCSMIAFDNHFRRGRQPVRLFGALVPRGVSVLFYSVRMAPDQYEPHSRLRANRLMPTLAAMLRTIETLFPAHRLLLASCLPCGPRTANCIGKRRLTSLDLATERATIKGSRPHSARGLVARASI
jgi:hypothetical protein